MYRNIDVFKNKSQDLACCIVHRSNQKQITISPRTQKEWNRLKHSYLMRNEIVKVNYRVDSIKTFILTLIEICS